jgi:predicted esterase
MFQHALNHLHQGVAAPIPLDRNSFKVAPGQTRVYCFRLSFPDEVPESVSLSLACFLDNGYRFSVPFTAKFNHKAIHEPHRVTHLHPGGIVSYAILRAPSEKASSASTQGRAPVLLQLHGAGVEAESDMVAHSLDSLPDLCAFVLFPTGVTPWSGDDWHSWGFADVEAAIANIPKWIERTQYGLTDVDTTCWIVSGHSNGGQGTWYALTHRPDNVIGAAPVSGYLSIQSYVPQTFWRPMDPRRRALLEAATNSSRHELLADNCDGIKIEQQHGQNDDNVPPYESRLMAQLLSETTSTGSAFNELPERGHWFDGVMTTPKLGIFYQQMCEEYQRQENRPLLSADATESRNWSVIVGNPADTGPKNGVKLLRVVDPASLGRIHVRRRGECWELSTRNLLAFSIKATSSLDNEPEARSISVDGQPFCVAGKRPIDVMFWKSIQGHWKRCTGNHMGIELCDEFLEELGSRHPGLEGVHPPLRTEKHLGGINAVLRTGGAFRVRHYGSGPFNTFDIALEISRNLQQYYRADSFIEDAETQPSALGDASNVTISIMVARVPDSSAAPFRFPIEIVDEKGRCGIAIRAAGTQHETSVVASQGITGAIFVRPLPSSATQLELVVWGATVEDAAWAARLIPTLTGVGQPDFVLFDQRIRWMGPQAAAMGFFDTFWNITPSSVLELW